MKKSEMYESICAVMTQWPHVVVNQATAEMWYRSFPDIEKDKFFSAIIAVMKTSKSGFAPTIGEVNNMISTLNAIKTDRLSDGDAWILVKKAVRKFGYCRMKEAFSWIKKQSPQAAYAIKQIGWQEFCNSDVKNEVGDRAHFLKLFGAIQTQETQKELLGIKKPNSLKQLSSEGAVIHQKIGDLVKLKSFP